MEVTEMKLLGILMIGASLLAMFSGEFSLSGGVALLLISLIVGIVSVK
jgi:hypothetical protein